MKILGSWERREPGIWSSRTLSQSCSHPLFLCFSLPGTSISPNADSPSPPAGDIVISSPSFASPSRVFSHCFFSFWLSGTWDLSSPTRAQTPSPCSGSALDSQGRPFTRPFLHLSWRRALIGLFEVSFHPWATPRAKEMTYCDIPVLVTCSHMSLPGREEWWEISLAGNKLKTLTVYPADAGIPSILK